MAKAREHIISEYDDERRLVAAGFRWHEMRYWLVELLARCGAALAILTPVAAAFAPTEYIVAAVVGIGATCWLVILRYGQRPRELVFHRDGRIDAPFGIPLRRRQRPMPTSHAVISSIEVNRAGINLYSTEGEIIRISCNLTEPVAHRAAVQLTKALREMRDSTSRLHRAQNTAPRAKRVAALID